MGTGVGAAARAGASSRGSDKRSHRVEVSETTPTTTPVHRSALRDAQTRQGKAELDRAAECTDWVDWGA